MYTLLLVVSLITGDPDEAVDAETAVLVKPLVVALALELELLDPREIQNEPFDTQFADCGIPVLRTRFRELKDVPLLADCCRLPNRDLTDNCVIFNREYKTWLEQQCIIYPYKYDEYMVIIREVDRLYHIWVLVQDAQVDTWFVTTRRKALKELLANIGGKAYYSGELPCHVPLEYFRKIEP